MRLVGYQNHWLETYEPCLLDAGYLTDFGQRDRIKSSALQVPLDQGLFTQIPKLGCKMYYSGLKKTNSSIGKYQGKTSKLRLVTSNFDCLLELYAEIEKG